MTYERHSRQKGRTRQLAISSFSLRPFSQVLTFTYVLSLLYVHESNEALQCITALFARATYASSMHTIVGWFLIRLRSLLGAAAYGSFSELRNSRELVSSPVLVIRSLKTNVIYSNYG